jgi:hypothetical protein
MSTAVALGLLFCLPQSATAADDRASFLVNLFITVCIPNMGSPDGVRAWAATKRLGQIEEAAPLAVFVGPGSDGAAWAIPTTIGKFALSIRGTTRACAVWAQAADASEVEGNFKKIIEGTKRPGVRVRVDKDNSGEGPQGHVRGLVYNIIAPGAPTGFEFTMLTAEHAGGPFQASLQVAKASAD